MDKLQLLASLAASTPNVGEVKDVHVSQVPPPIVLPKLSNSVVRPPPSPSLPVADAVDDAKMTPKSKADIQAKQEKKLFQGYAAIVAFNQQVYDWVKNAQPTDPFPRIVCPFSSPSPSIHGQHKIKRGRGRPKLAYTAFFDWNQIAYFGQMFEPFARAAKQAASFQEYMQVMNLTESYQQFLTIKAAQSAEPIQSSPPAPLAPSGIVPIVIPEEKNTTKPSISRSKKRPRHEHRVHFVIDKKPRKMMKGL